MKLTKKKLEQLIMEEYVRAVGDEDKPINYPQYRDKLTALSKNDPHQARELADSLDEADETVTMTLSNVSNATISDSTGTFTITDDDATPSLSINDVSTSDEIASGQALACSSSPDCPAQRFPSLIISSKVACSSVSSSW